VTRTTPGEQPPDPGTAEHGAPSEVTWQGGAGRQPYANQGAEEAREPNGGDEFSGGDRGELSGRNLEQLEQAKGPPRASEHAEQHQQQDEGQWDAEKPENDGH
jgi:hypothetical protein